MIEDFQLKSGISEPCLEIPLNLGDGRSKVGYNGVICSFRLKVLRIMRLYLQGGGINHVKERTRSTI